MLLVGAATRRNDERHRVEDDVELQYYRLQKISEGAIDLSEGEADPLKGPTEVGTGQSDDAESTFGASRAAERALRHRLRPRRPALLRPGRSEAPSEDEELQAAARANTLENFAYVFGRALERLFVERMEGNEQIVRKIMTDPLFRTTAADFLMREVYERIWADPRTAR